MPGGTAAPLTELTDKDLLQLHVEGNDEAFGELFRRHKDRMWAVAVRTVRDPELAADCVQDAFIAAVRRAGSFRGEAAVTTWLHRIVVNACLDRLRRRRPTSELPSTASPTATTTTPPPRCALTSTRRSPGFRRGNGRPSCSSTCTRCPWPRQR